MVQFHQGHLIQEIPDLPRGLQGGQGLIKAVAPSSRFVAMTSASLGDMSRSRAGTPDFGQVDVLGFPHQLAAWAPASEPRTQLNRIR